MRLLADFGSSSITYFSCQTRDNLLKFLFASGVRRVSFPSGMICCKDSSSPPLSKWREAAFLIYSHGRRYVFLVVKRRFTRSVKYRCEFFLAELLQNSRNSGHCFKVEKTRYFSFLIPFSFGFPLLYSNLIFCTSVYRKAYSPSNHHESFGAFQRPRAGFPQSEMNEPSQRYGTLLIFNYF